MRQFTHKSTLSMPKVASKRKANPLSSETVTEKTPIPPPDWEALIAQIADDIVAERSPARILQVRAKLYDLLTHCIPPTTILKTLAFKLIALIDDGLKGEVIQWAAFYEHRIKT